MVYYTRINTRKTVKHLIDQRISSLFKCVIAADVAVVELVAAPVLVVTELTLGVLPIVELLPVPLSACTQPIGVNVGPPAL